MMLCAQSTQEVELTKKHNTFVENVVSSEDKSIADLPTATITEKATGGTE